MKNAASLLSYAKTIYSVFFQGLHMKTTMTDIKRQVCWQVNETQQ